jgi:thymidylate kinase
VFQTRVLAEYDRIVPEHGLEVIDASRSITEQQRVLRALISDNLNRTTP